ncbi:ribonuclease P protein component [Mycoplasma nasistruthionis]|uniref:Ribonuclease P protein component n=1 Tax=Mycoplasma nasistruthionis TaxID=353852 RepID=A0A5B7XVS2_9MOLU|nr:ribonuclease P protein component [Mycoplasma nasistruthionis]QCZ36879.1 ribonuclease P protein component [Mycoplasma nasistruthionis]
MYRLRKNWEFDKVLNNGKGDFLINKQLIVYFRKSKYHRVGLTVPKKFAIATQRNYFKRQLKAILHEVNITDLLYDFVLIVRKDFINTSFQHKLNETKKLFEKFRKNEKK